MRKLADVRREYDEATRVQREARLFSNKRKLQKIVDDSPDATRLLDVAEHYRAAVRHLIASDDGAWAAIACDLCGAELWVESVVLSGATGSMRQLGCAGCGARTTVPALLVFAEQNGIQ